MPDELELLEETQADEDTQLEGTEADEPQTSLPEPAGKTQDRQEIIDETLEEGVDAATTEAVIEELGDTKAFPQLTVEDLRKLPGSESLTDDEIRAEWAKAVQQARGEGQTAQAGEEFKLPFPVYDKQGNKVDFDKVNLKDLIEGNLQVGYNALGKEQRKTLQEALRNASLGHFNEQRYNTTIQERNQVAAQVAELNKQVEQFNNERKTWDAALTALAMGNIEPMKRLAQAYQQAITAMPQAAPGMIPVSQVQAEQQQIADGQRFINEVILPAAADIAKRYDANPREVAGAIETLIRRDLGFLTKEKIEQIIQFEVPQLFEANGYTAVAPGAERQQPVNEVEELKKTVQALQERIAGNNNQQVQQVRQKQKKTPPVGSGAVPSAGDSMPSFKNRAQMKAWMASDPEWQKA